MTPTGKAIDDFFRSLTAGSRIQCVQNSLIPKHVGVVGVVTKPGRTRIDLDVDGQSGFSLTPPKRVRDCRDVSEDSITYVVTTARGESVVQWVKCECDAAETGEGHRIGCAVALAGLKLLAS